MARKIEVILPDLPAPFVPNAPRSMAAVREQFSGRNDARWRGVARNVGRINRLDVAEGRKRPMRPLTPETVR